MNWEKILTDGGCKDPEMIAGAALLDLMVDGQPRTWAVITSALPNHEGDHLRKRLQRFITVGRMACNRTHKIVRVDGQVRSCRMGCTYRIIVAQGYL